MKKFMILISAFGLMVGTGFAQSGTCGENLTWTLKDSTLTIRGTGEMDNYTTDIGAMSFSSSAPWNDYRYQIKHVEIEYGATSIGWNSFFDCGNLISVTIPNSVTSIENAFFSCTSLTSVEIPNSVTNIAGAFSWCRALSSVTIPNSITSIGDFAFFWCSLTSIEIPNSVTSIGANAFNSCSLTSVEIPSSVTSIGYQAFWSCTSLTSIEIPNSVISIEEQAFYGCSSLTSIKIPNGVTSIGKRTFDGCSSLISVEIPNSITSIGANAFRDCSSLTSIEIPSSVISIGADAFNACSSLTFIEIPSSVTSIENKAFWWCLSLTSIINYSNIPQNIESNVFTSFNQANCALYVPAESVELYKQTAVWKEFTILPILPGATVTNVSDIEIPAGVGIVVVPERESARIAWNVTEVAVENAVGYTLVITKVSNNETICTLEFDAMGRLVGVTLKSQSDVFGVRITNLSENTTYNYTMKAMGANNVVLSTKTGTFTTTGGSGNGNDVGIVETWRAASLPAPGIVGYFNLTGQKLAHEPERGVYIILYDNGTSKTVVRK